MRAPCPREQRAPCRVWAPPESPLRVEFSTDLLRDVRAAGTSVDAFGTLYGACSGKTVRVVSTRGQAGLTAIGVFASRVRGEVFLTEEDLERFETAGANVALVVAAERCGFFVRDAGGAIEAVRSYEEFFIQPPAAPDSKCRRWSWAYAFALLPLLAFAIPHRTAPSLALHLQEDAGQLKVSWNQPRLDTLSILDGGSLITVDVKPDQSRLTYVRRSGDVTVKLGPAQARFIGPPMASRGVEEVRTSIRALQARLAKLRGAMAAGKARIASLQRRLQ
ncbi:MAG TPA: hypothetical protein VMT15_02700 [Bryobacteraceae bacterium]|nr:hypothetical protein [Bryobacteraceae bacterium]